MLFDLDLKAQIDHASDRLTKSEVGRAKSEKDADKLTKLIESNEVAFKLTEGELEQLSEQIRNGAEASETVRKAVEQAQDVLSGKRDDLAEMKKDLDEKVAIITQFRKREVGTLHSFAFSTATDLRTLPLCSSSSSSTSALSRSSSTNPSTPSRTGVTSLESYSSTKLTSTSFRFQCVGLQLTVALQGRRRRRGGEGEGRGADAQAGQRASPMDRRGDP